MGITISHTNLAPISLISTLIGFISFAFTLGTFIKVFWSNLGTFAAAPQEITDFLSSLKQGLLEERRHLRRARRRLKSLRRDQSHGARESDDDFVREYSSNGGKRRTRGRAGPRGRSMHFNRGIQSMRSVGEQEALRIMRITVKDLITSFRGVEQPFLKAEYQQQDAARWTRRPSSPSPYYSEKHVHSSRHVQSRTFPASDDDSRLASHMHSTNRLGHEYRACGIKERWLWVRRKADVINLSQTLSRVEVQRTAHEVGEVLNMVCDIGRDVEDMQTGIHALESRLNRVIGVRRVD